MAIRGFTTSLLLVGLMFPVLADEDLPEDIALLEFLGTIAGLEGMGIEIDAMLGGDVEVVIPEDALGTEEEQS